MPVADIRDAHPDDAEAIAALLGQLGYPTSAEEAVRRLADLRRSPADRVLVAVAGAEVVGLVALNISHLLAEGGCVARMTSVVVREGHRGAGVGRMLVETAERLARGAGCDRIQVSSGKRPERREAHRFYPRLGYADAALHHMLYEKDLRRQ